MSSPSKPPVDLSPIQRLATFRSWDLLAQLTDEVGPRYPCTPGDVAGVAWALETLRACGFTNVRKEAAPATLWRRGEEACTLFLPRAQPVVLSALGGSVGTPADGIEAEVAMFGSLADLDAAPADEVAGKIVYLHHVMPRLRDGTGYNAGSTVRTSGPSRAAKKGALACLVRSIGTDSMRAAHTGALFYEPGAPEIPAAALSIPDGDMLHRFLARDGARARARLALDCAPLPVGESFNVLGEIPGTDLADEIVLLGAHLDSWDLGTGALDDGAGCAVAIEAARIVASLPTRPRRTLRVVLFANEELGSGGGLAYARDHAAEAPRHAVAMEVDQGDGRPWALRVPSDRRDGAVTASLVAALEPLGIALDAGPARGGVDIAPLRQLGVPFADLRQDATRYFDFHHTANDVLENVVRADLDLTTRAFATAIAVLAHADSTFREIR